MGKILFLFMLVLALFASEERMVEAKMCQTTGNEFSCFNDSTCNKSCEKDGFISGKCDGAARRCTCYKQC
ncbi:hypothetical protein R6Q59_037092 [Mikania micrantha]